MLPFGAEKIECCAAVFLIFLFFFLRSFEFTFLPTGEGSVDKLLRGKHYNNCMRVYNYLFEALTRQKIESFQQWLIQKDRTDDLCSLTSSPEFESALDGINGPRFESLMTQHGSIIELLEEYERHLEDENGAGPVAALWQSFLQMMNILFAFIRSIRTVDWQLHMDSTQRMLPWMFAYDRPNYSRFLSFYWTEMQNLPSKHPSIYEEFR